jgi:hypothetical protein
MALLLAMGGTLFFVSRWFKNSSLAEIAVILTALSPATTHYFVEGRSDAFALFWLVGALYFFKKRTLWLSAVLFAMGVLSKQTIWFAVPLYLSLIYFQSKKRLSALVMPAGIIGVLSLIFITPFLLWDAKGFIDSTILYLSAGGETGYPISGYGLSMILFELGIVKGLHDSFPFVLIQLAAGIPALGISLWVLRKRPTVPRFFFTFAITLFAFWYTSRYFNNSHVAVISTLFCLGILKEMDERAHGSLNHAL